MLEACFCCVLELPIKNIALLLILGIPGEVAYSISLKSWLSWLSFLVSKFLPRALSYCQLKKLADVQQRVVLQPGAVLV
jgi:hypothetical protein